MTNVDVSKIRPGDVVGVRVLELLGVGGCVGIDPGPVYGRTYIQPSAIVSHTPAPRPALKVGDRVLDCYTDLSREVIWIEEQYVYLAPLGAGNQAGVRPLSEVETWERV